ncbi:hypothetical protein JI747_014090 [Chryseobacterium sp. RG1]|uniref:DUF4468 domain-containing protein n=1 Tax=Chryseobacterium tagetis TaxID=2801334 RepID=A0ABS8A4R2_9FLAO|nr:hypothetical protein [Chryseobacterium tagetis]MCA6068318.1 hypothetical protein [Chryseobacterium tagetis]
MKSKILLLLLLWVGAVWGQAKPTKEETENYIVNFFKNKNFAILKQKVSNTDEVISTENSCEDIVFNGCEMVLKFKQTSKVDNDDFLIGVLFVKLTFPMNLVESIKKDGNYIDFATGKDAISVFASSNDSYYKGFTGDLKKQTYSLLCNSNSTGDIDKLVKGLNYLRKLCGASEPISFD